MRGHGEVWSHKDGTASWLSLALMSDKCRVTLDTAVDQASHLHRGDGATGRLSRVACSLCVCRAPRRSEMALVTAVAGKKLDRTNLDVRRATAAHRLQETMNCPSAASLLRMMDNNSVKNCPVTRRDIKMDSLSPAPSRRTDDSNSFLPKKKDLNTTWVEAINRLVDNMPTRIIFNDTVTSRNNTPLFRSTTSSDSAVTSENNTSVNARSTPSRINQASRKRKSSRKIVQLKSSLIRGKNINGNFRALSSEDIRASPRLLGYCFQLLASIVMLISVSTFHGEEEGENYTEIWSIFNRTRGDSKELFYSNESRAVFAWKLFGCFAVSGLGTIITLVIILVHFDTICFPSYWVHNFRDGSKCEQVLLAFLVVFWGVGLHVNTSSLSVGQSQANVFFTSWISFFSAILNYGVWRISAGHRSIANLINEHHRETTYNWVMLLICSLVFAGAICDTYLNREYIKLYFQGQELSITAENWIYIIAIPWAVVGISIISIVLNHFLRKSCEVRVCKGKFVLLGWRQAEGMVAFVMTVVLFWIVFTYTGGNGVFNGLNNVYFGVWGAFMNSVLLLATWLRENKNIEFIQNEECGRETQMVFATR